jgi:succinate dehydrogenase / fumarate reductase, cytochrome b subunit
MNWLTQTLTSTIGRKVTMAATGLFLVTFLVVHMLGNLKLFANDGGEAFNHYTEFMSTNPVIRIAEWILLAGFGIHIYVAAVLTRKNAGARPVKYAYTKASPGVNWFSRNMGTSGTIVLIFLLVHLVQFYGGYHYGGPKEVTYESGDTYKDMYGIVEYAFTNQWYTVVLYVGAMVLLGFHLNHGFQSAFRTFGLQHAKYTPIVQGLGVLLSILFPVGFASMPLFFVFKAMMGM